MTGPLRIEFPGAVYHMTAGVNAKQPIFLDHTDRTAFLELLSLVLAGLRHVEEQSSFLAP
jgi:putative transposase